MREPRLEILEESFKNFLKGSNSYTILGRITSWNLVETLGKIYEKLTGEIAEYFPGCIPAGGLVVVDQDINAINPQAIALLYFVQHVEKISLFVLSISVALTVVANRASYTEASRNGWHKMKQF